MTAKRLMSAAIFMLFLWASMQAQDMDVLKIDVGLVTVNVNVSDSKGRPFSTLKAEDFELTDEGQKVELGFFESHGPASIVFIVDMSSSMKGSKWRDLKAGLKQFLTRAPEGSVYTLIGFSDSPQLIARSVDARELWRRLNTLHPSGETALYDAILFGLNTLEGVPQRHRVLVVLSDGQDTVSRAGRATVQQKALAQRTTIYTVGILPEDPSLLPYGPDGKRPLNDLAVATGGLVHFPFSSEVADALKRINADMLNQYSLSYYPPDKRPGWRHIQISLAQDTGRLKLRYQQSYLIK